MLNQYIENPLILGIIQVILSMILSFSIVQLAQRFQIDLQKESYIAHARGIIQIVGISLILALLLKSSIWIGIFILFLMIILGAKTASQRVKHIKGSFKVCLYGLLIGAGLVIIFMLITGLLKLENAMIIPVGSMIIANAMNVSAQALERFRSDIENTIEHIEGYIALGATPFQAVHNF